MTISTWPSDHRMAIIRNPKALVEDHSRNIAIVITCYVEEGIAADHWITLTDPQFKSLWQHMNGNVENLNGKPCLVKEYDVNSQEFVRMLDI